MYHKNRIEKTSISCNESYTGESIEGRVKRLVYNQESIGDGAPLIYTDRRKGVQPEYNIRSDRFDIALDSMDKVHSDKLAKRVEMYKEPSTNKNDGSIDATTK
jgi:hypothetical protein